MDIKAFAMQKLVDSIAREVVDSVNDVLATEANSMVRDMRGRVPKRSGALEDSIRAERLPLGANSVGVKIKAGGLATMKEVRKGSGLPYDYAAGVEWGNHHVAAQPFFFSTYRAHKAEAKNAIKAGVNAAMQKAVKEAGR
jgi:HK97 gp10 family phage protein